jgi:hypothetical protein
MSAHVDALKFQIHMKDQASVHESINFQIQRINIQLGGSAEKIKQFYMEHCCKLVKLNIKRRTCINNSEIFGLNIHYNILTGYNSMLYDDMCGHC